MVALVGADRNLLDLVDGHLRRPPQAFDDDLRADAILDVLLDLLQNLSSQHNDRCSSISYLSVLRSCDIDEDAGGGVNDVEQLQNFVSIRSKVMRHSQLVCKPS